MNPRRYDQAEEAGESPLCGAAKAWDPDIHAKGVLDSRLRGNDEGGFLPPYQVRGRLRGLEWCWNDRALCISRNFTDELIFLQEFFTFVNNITYIFAERD